jgi:SPOR domain
MRNLFLLLVLVNLGFAAWHSWFATPAAAPEQRAASTSSVPSLTLVSEAAPQPAAGSKPAADEPAADEPAASAPEPAAEPAPARCISVGPFREISQAATAAASLRAAGYEPSQRVAEGDIWVGYWVYIAGIPTREEANEKLALLQANDISDSYVTPGDAGYLISLGVFSEIARAARRRGEVRALGLEPSVADRTRRGTVYWVDVSLAAGQTLDLEALQTPGRITRLEQRSCGTASP